MRPSLLRCRFLVHSALAVLVVAALSRCSWEESHELAQSMRTAAALQQGDVAPIQAPVHGCDRESGCICRGATQVVAIAATHCKPICSELLPADLTPAVNGWLIDVATAASMFLDDDRSGPPISGRQLRALYASLVI